MFIEYACRDGSRTVASRPSMALLHWVGRAYPPHPARAPRASLIHIAPTPLPHDVEDRFLRFAMAEVKRRRRKKPPLTIIRPSRHEEDGGAAYQARCLEILCWLDAEGDIVHLTVSL